MQASARAPTWGLAEAGMDAGQADVVLLQLLEEVDALFALVGLKP